MLYVAHLRDRETGEERTVERDDHRDGSWPDLHPALDRNVANMWAGNYGCDCNRAKWFGFEEYACNEGPNRFVLLDLRWKDGRRIAIEEHEANGGLGPDPVFLRWQEEARAAETSGREPPDMEQDITQVGEGVRRILNLRTNAVREEPLDPEFGF
jgi:hypothetical protein